MDLSEPNMVLKGLTVKDLEELHDNISLCIWIRIVQFQHEYSIRRRFLW